MTPCTPIETTRRRFLRETAACAAHLALLAAASPARAARAFAATRRRVVAQEPWGRIEEVGDGVWALISTPLRDRTTLCNGGIIRGRSGVLVVESFARPEGATWLAGKARELTGRWPDVVALTHYHSDHTAGLAGFASAGDRPRVHTTAATRDLVRELDRRRSEDPASTRSQMLDGVVAIDAVRETSVDLGDRTARIVPRDGHTRSDVTIEIGEPSVVFCGDLVWNRMFPNYVDAVPSRLNASVLGLMRARNDTVWVPGHGPLADTRDLGLYVAVLEAVEAAARGAREKGQSADEAAAAFTLPDAAREWTLFNPRYFEIAIGAWLKELAHEPPPGRMNRELALPEDPGGHQAGLVRDDPARHRIDDDPDPTDLR